MSISILDPSTILCSYPLAPRGSNFCCFEIREGRTVKRMQSGEGTVGCGWVRNTRERVCMGENDVRVYDDSGSRIVGEEGTGVMEGLEVRGKVRLDDLKTLALRATFRAQSYSHARRASSLIKVIIPHPNPFCDSLRSSQEVMVWGGGAGPLYNTGGGGGGGGEGEGGEGGEEGEGGVEVRLDEEQIDEL